MRIPNKSEVKWPGDGCTDGSWEEVLCDKCGKSCRDSEGMNFEYAEIKATWGYGSNKDLYRDEAQVCEPCYDGLGIKPQRTTYM